MKTFKRLLCIVMAVIMLMFAVACNETSPTPDDEATPTPDTTDEATPTPDDTTPTPEATPEPTPTPEPPVPSAPAEITKEALEILTAAEITTGAGGQHGAQQTRICHTDHGTYVAFVSYTEDSKYYFYIVKINDDGTAAVLYQDWSPFDAALVNVLQDTVTGDVIVTAIPIDKIEPTNPETAWLALYFIDPETDEVTEYKERRQLAVTSRNGFGYSMPVIDTENRKLYAIYAGGNDPGQFSWFTFDLDKREWLPENLTITLDDVRYCYLYCFPDGNGGMTIVAERDIPVEMVDLTISGSTRQADYVWDQLVLYYIPDMTKEEYTSVMIHEADYSRGSEGIAPNVSNNQYGDAFMDQQGRLHVLYTVRMIDYNKYGPLSVVSRETRHAVYKGTECVYNELITFAKDNKPLDQIYAMRMTQTADGVLYIFAVPMEIRTKTAQIEVYRCTNNEGTEFELEQILEVGSFKPISFSISCPRGGSTQDNVVDCLFFVNGEKKLYTCSITLH